MRCSRIWTQWTRPTGSLVRSRVANPRAPFICARCRHAQLASSTAAFQAFHRRQYTVSSRLAQQSAQADSSTTRKESPIPQSHYDFFPQTFPDGPPPNSPFSPDLRKLRKEFLQSQAKTHPDLVPASQKRQAEALSMRINEAYKTLQDPLKRAQYLLLTIHGVDVEDESAKLEENELLMEVMEAREAVDETESEDDLVGIREENDEKIAQSVAVLEQAFAEGRPETAAEEAVRLRYWMNIEESIHGWEKGKGGGVIHH